MVCTFTLREESRLRVFQNRILMRIFGHKKDEVAGDWRKLRNEELHDLYTRYSGVQIEKNETGEGGCMWHIWWRGEVHSGFWWGNLTERDPLEDSGVDGRIILN
jgi:hypothetical protein